MICLVFLFLYNLLDCAFLVWNCQGVAKVGFKHVLKSFVKIYKPILVALLEPRITGMKAEKVIKSLGFKYSHRVEVVGFSGGIWLM